MFALSRASEKILRAADAWSDIAATRAEAFERMQVWHADVPPHGGDALVFDAAEMGERDLGVIAENSGVAGGAGRRRAARGHRARDRRDHVRSRRSATPWCLSAGDRRVRARLVVGADGAAVAQCASWPGLGAARGDYGQTAIVAMVQHRAPA